MLLYDVAMASQQITATRSRLAKRDILVAILQQCQAHDVEIVVAYLAGELRQRRTGVGWAGLSSIPDAAAEPTLTVVEVDRAFQGISEIGGTGSAQRRSESVTRLFERATVPEQALLRGLVFGDLRQGALDAAMLDAVAAATGVPLDAVRRAAMLRGATGPIAVAALTGGLDAVTAFGLTVGQPVRPMLAASAPDIAQALEKTGVPASLDTKLDGIRVQVHQAGDDITIFTRSLDDITARLPEVTDVVRGFARRSLILDGEVVTLDARGRPRPFQETASRTASQSLASTTPAEVAVFFFDVLHLDGEDLIDRPLSQRLAVLDAVVPSAQRVSRTTTSDPQVGHRFFVDAVGAGQEGLVVKSLSAPYDAGRRGSAWVKVKPRHTLDLVVLAVEWGSGRRQGWLSNIHLGARNPDADGFVMLGKTFKGMTDEMLSWQTERFQQLETHRDGHVVYLRPEQVVEIAFDGLQRSTRYPGGLALRFARVLRYRDDKSAGEADTISAVRELVAD